MTEINRTAYEKGWEHWHGTSLQTRLNDLYVASKNSLGENSQVLEAITRVAGNRGYSHAKRIERINEIINPIQHSLSDSERGYVRELLGISYGYLAEKKQLKTTGHVKLRRKVKDFTDVARNITELRREIDDSGYNGFSYLERIVAKQQKKVTRRDSFFMKTLRTAAKVAAMIFIGSGVAGVLDYLSPRLTARNAAAQEKPAIVARAEANPGSILSGYYERGLKNLIGGLSEQAGRIAESLQTAVAQTKYEKSVAPETRIQTEQTEIAAGSNDIQENNSKTKAKETEEIKPVEPSEADLISWKNPVRDVFSPIKSRIKSLEIQVSTEAERLMRIAAEAHVLLNRDSQALKFYTKAKSLSPEIDDSDLIIAIKKDIGISNFYLEKARAKLEDGDKLGAWNLTYSALMFNGDATQEAQQIREQCGILTAIVGDLSGYGDYLCFDGDVRCGGERIKPLDNGMYPTTLSGSLKFTGHHAGKLGKDIAESTEKNINATVGRADGVGSFFVYGTEGLLGGFGKYVLGLEGCKKVDWSELFDKNMTKVDRRIRNAYGKGTDKTYLGHPWGEPIVDVWKIGNDVVNTAGGVGLVAFNATARPTVEGVAVLLGGEEGFKTGHEIANIIQIPGCAVLNTVIVFGNDEPKKMQSFDLQELGEAIYFTGPTELNTIDGNFDRIMGLDEVFTGLPVVQGLVNPIDNYSTVTQRVWRWASNFGQGWLISGCCHEGGDGGSPYGGGQTGGPGGGGGSGGGGQGGGAGGG